MMRLTVSDYIIMNNAITFGELNKLSNGLLSSCETHQATVKQQHLAAISSGIFNKR